MGVAYHRKPGNRMTFGTRERKRRLDFGVLRGPVRTRIRFLVGGRGRDIPWASSEELEVVYRGSQSIGRFGSVERGAGSEVFAEPVGGMEYLSG